METLIIFGCVVLAFVILDYVRKVENTFRNVNAYTKRQSHYKRKVRITRSITVYK